MSTDDAALRSWVARVRALLDAAPVGSEIYAMDRSLYLLTPDGAAMRRRIAADRGGADLHEVREHLIIIGPVADSGGW